MAELTVLGYRPGRTSLHLLDIRCKMILLFTINLLVFRISLPGLSLLSGLLGALFIWQKLPLGATLRQTRWFFLLLGFVLISRTLFTPGVPIISNAFINLSRPGLESGLYYCWRLILVMLCGLLFVTSSKTSDIKAGIQWFLKPLPFIPEKRVAVMISLMIRFLPMILKQASAISEAQRARAVEHVKNPLRRLYLLSIPLLKGIFKTADGLVLAMEARCYSETRTDPELVLTLKDWLILIGALLAMMGLFFL